MTKESPPNQPRLSELIEWDVTNWSYALDYWRKHSSQDLTRVRALELGSKNGGLSLWLASLGATVVCTDRQGPTELARKLHARYGVVDRIERAKVDALAVPYDEEFDIVIFKSILGGVGRKDNREAQKLAVDQMYRALKPGGELLFAENLVGCLMHRNLRRLSSWRRYWGYVTIDDILEMTSCFSSVQYCTRGFLGGLGFTEHLKRMLGHVDRLALEWVVPESWKYIIMGVARK